MGYYDGKGYWREDGEGGYDSQGYWREAGEGGYDGKGYWRNAGEGSYDSEGYWREAGEGGYDSQGYWRDGAHSAASDEAVDPYAGSSGSSYGGGSSSGDYYGGSGGGTTVGGHAGSSFIDRLFGKCMELLFKGMLVVVAIWAIWMGLRYLGAKIGLLKSTLTVSLETVTNEEIDTSQLQIVAVARYGSYKETTADYDGEAQNVSIKLREGDYDLYFQYDGGLYWVGQIDATGLDDYDRTFDTAVLDNRVVVITLCDADGEEISLTGLTITDAEGEPVSCCQGSDGRYYAVYDGSSEAEWTFHAEGYADAQIDFDGGDYRVGDIKVMISGS